MTTPVSGERPDTSRPASNVLGLLACPACQSDLRFTEATITCTQCHSEWPIRDGVLSFAPDVEDYWGEVTREQMQDLLTTTQSDSWESAVRGPLAQSAADFIGSVVAESRGDWRFLVDLPRPAAVMDIGSGLGQLANIIARDGHCVVSCELIPERAAFQELRRQQQRLDELCVVQADAFNPPCRRGAFDLIILNGVFEWVGVWDPSRPVDDLQLEVLRRCWSLLRPGGHLYIGIENRLSFYSLLGAVDHSGLRFTNLMPRWLADWSVAFSQRRKTFRTEISKARYRTYTYTLRGYQNLLSAAGFQTPVTFLPFPRYSRPSILFPEDGQRELAWYFHNVYQPHSIRYFALSKIFAALGRLRLARLFAPHYALLAAKPTSE